MDQVLKGVSSNLSPLVIQPDKDPAEQIAEAVLIRFNSLSPTLPPDIDGLDEALMRLIDRDVTPLNLFWETLDEVIPAQMDAHRPLLARIRSATEHAVATGTVARENLKMIAGQYRACIQYFQPRPVFRHGKEDLDGHYVLLAPLLPQELRQFVIPAPSNNPTGQHFCRGAYVHLLRYAEQGKITYWPDEDPLGLIQSLTDFRDYADCWSIPKAQKDAHAALQRYFNSRSLDSQLNLLELALEKNLPALAGMASDKLTHCFKWDYRAGRYSPVRLGVSADRVLSIKIMQPLEETPQVDFLKPLKRLTRFVTHIEVPNNYLGCRRFAKFLAKSPQLRSVTVLITPCKASRGGFDKVEALPQVETIQLVGRSREKFKHRGLVALVSRCTNLSRLIIKNCGAINPHVLERLLPENSNVNQLTLRGLDLDDSTVKGVLKNAKPGELKSLDLSHNPRLTASCLNHLAKYSPALERLSLHGCGDIKEKALSKALSKMERLRDLFLHGCTHITDATVQAIATHCPNISQLNFNDTAVSYSNLSQLLSTRPQITSLWFEHENLAASTEPPKAYL